jgi:hypothetical protein
MLPIHEMTSRELQEEIQNERAKLEEILIRKQQIENNIMNLVNHKIHRDNN